MSRKGQQSSAGQGAGMVHAAGAVGEAVLCLEPSVGNGKGYGLPLSSKRAAGESCWGSEVGGFLKKMGGLSG